jgi:FG-GAP repeat
MDRQIQLSTAPLRALSVVASVPSGGTGASDDVTAAAALGAIHRPSLGEVANVLRLEATGKFDPSLLPKSAIRYPQLSGESTIHAGVLTSFTISNFDINETYSATISAGSVSIAGDQVTILAPAVPQTVTLTLNGRQIKIPVVALAPNQPKIIAPVDGATGLTNSLTIYSTDFSIALPAGDVHQSSDWELATDAAFTDVKASLFNTTSLLTAWTVSGLEINTDYFIRVRHRGYGYGYSAWSTVVKFRTDSDFIPNKEQSKLLPYDSAALDRFGNCISATNDGSKVVVASYLSSPGGIGSAGSIYVFKRFDTSWALEQKISPADRAANDLFGYCIGMAADGTRLIASSIQATNPTSNSGAVYVYVFNSGTGLWTLEQKFAPADVAGGDRFGFSCAISSDGSRIMASSRNAVISGNTEAGAVYIFSRSGSVWSQEAKIVDPAVATNNLFGYMADIDGAGSRVAIGSLQGDSASVANSGSVHIFVRTGTTWTLEAKVTASDPVANNYFGCPVKISQDGTRLVAGSSGGADPGSAYVFRRNASAWTQEVKLLASDGLNGNRFGFGVAMNNDGSRVVVGALLGDSAVSDSGAAYLFTRNVTTWSQSLKFNRADAPAVNDYYGGTVAISPDGRYAFISAYQYDSGGNTDSGGVYVYV